MKRYILSILLVLLAVPCLAGTLDLKQSTARTIPVGPFMDPTDGSPETSLTVTSVDGTLFKATGTASDLGAITASAGSNDMVHQDDGMYSLEITAANTDTAGDLTLCLFIADALVFKETYNVLPANIYDSKYSTDKLEVDAVLVDGQTATATGEVTFPNATLASTTNITGGTITTATNLTNAPTAGDFTATMKTSLETAAGNSLATYDGPTDTEMQGYRDEILNVVRQYNNYRHVGSGQTHATIGAAITAASAGDLVVVHAGTYQEENIGKHQVDIYLSQGALLHHGTSPTFAIFDQAQTTTLKEFRVFGPGTLETRNAEDVPIVNLTQSATRIVIECGIVRGVEDGWPLVIAATGFDGTCNICPQLVDGLPELVKTTGGTGTLRIAAPVINFGTLGAYGAAGVTTYIEGGRLTTATSTIVSGTAGRIIVNGDFVLTSGGSAGLNAPSGITIIAGTGSVNVPAGQPAFSGTGTVQVGPGFGYEPANVNVTGTFVNNAQFPLAQVDSGATAPLRTGADSDTGETLSDEIALLPTADKLLAYFQLALRGDAFIKTDRSTELTEINANEGSGGGTYDQETDTLEGASLNGSSFETLLDDYGMDTVKNIVNQIDKSTQTIIEGTVGTGSTTSSLVVGSIDLDAGSVDCWKGLVIKFSRDTTTAGLRGQGARITANTTGSTPTITVTTLTDAPVSGDTFVIQ